MIADFMNPYYQNLDGVELIPSKFQTMFKDYMMSIDECLMLSFKKLYSAEVFGKDSFESLKNINILRLSYYKFLFMKEEIDIDIINDDIKSEEYYLTKYGLDCESYKEKLVCIKCKDYEIIDKMIVQENYEFSTDFNEDFNA